jgi:DNA-binding transcriptional ArsR family regulator
MRPPELEARHRASAIVARMYLRTLQAMMGDFALNNISATLPELLVAMVIRLNDYQQKPPVSISEIARITGISRRTVRRHTERLLGRGVVIRKDDGILGNDAYLEQRVDAAYFREIVAAIRDAAKELEDY